MEREHELQDRETDWKAKNSFMYRMGEPPSEKDIRKNEDGSLYLPISHIQSLLDDVFCGQWNFEVKESKFGRKWARGSGYIEATIPHTNTKIKRNGDAGIILTGNLRLDSPRLEAMILLSCAKKFGRLFGRDLNRDKDDAPLPIVKVERPSPSSEEKRLKILIDECDDIEELKSYRLVVPPSLKEAYEQRLSELS